MGRAPSGNVREQILERLTEITVVRDPQIDECTELYGDLRISGADLYDFVSWVSTEFGADFSGMQLSRYSPPEGMQLLALFDTYESLTVGAILNALAKGSWVNSENPNA